MESWKKVWRDGIAPQLSTMGLYALKSGLLLDDPRLIQGATTCPPPMPCVEDWPVEGCCVLSYGSWQTEELETVGELEQEFARICFEADQALGEPAACRYFLNWYDDVARDEMRDQLLAEIDLVLAERIPINEFAAYELPHENSEAA